MAGVWSVRVLVLIVQLSEFRAVAENTRLVRHIFPRLRAFGDRLPASSKPAMEAPLRNRSTRFGAFEVDLRSGELYTSTASA